MRGSGSFPNASSGRLTFGDLDRVRLKLKAKAMVLVEVG